MLIHRVVDDVVLFRDSAAPAEKLMMLEKNFDFVILPSSPHRRAKGLCRAIHPPQDHGALRPPSRTRAAPGANDVQCAIVTVRPCAGAFC
jgi:hypothetical protein